MLLLRPGFATRDVFDGACRVARVRPRIVLESGEPQSLVALAEADRGVAIVPSTVLFPRRDVHAAPILSAGTSVGVWGSIVWNPRRFMQAYARAFIDEITAYTRRTYPGRQYDRHAPPVPRPGEEREVPGSPPAARRASGSRRGLVPGAGPGRR
jgi:DNA-binding transcriptional LysR family regulator